MPAVRLPETPITDIKLPPLPQTISRIARLMGKKDADIQELIEIVELDPSVAARLLRHVNSAFYGLPQKISRVDRAVLLLGFTKVCNLEMASSMAQIEKVFKDPGQREVYYQIVRHSLATAMLADELASLLHLPDHKVVFTAGLMHNIGQIVLLYNSPDMYEALWWSSESGLAPLVEEERIIFGKDHHELGLEGAAAWSFPEELQETIAYYDTPLACEESPWFEVVCTVGACVPLARALYPSNPDLIDATHIETLPEVLMHLSRSEELIEEAWDQVLNVREKTRLFVQQMLG